MTLGVSVVPLYCRMLTVERLCIQWGAESIRELCVKSLENGTFSSVLLWTWNCSKSLFKKQKCTNSEMKKLSYMLDSSVMDKLWCVQCSGSWYPTQIPLLGQCIASHLLWAAGNSPCFLFRMVSFVPAGSLHPPYRRWVPKAGMYNSSAFLPLGRISHVVKDPQDPVKVRFHPNLHLHRAASFALIPLSTLGVSWLTSQGLICTRITSQASPSGNWPIVAPVFFVYPDLFYRILYTIPLSADRYFIMHSVAG